MAFNFEYWLYMKKPRAVKKYLKNQCNKYPRLTILHLQNGCKLCRNIQEADKCTLLSSITIPL